MKQKSIWKVCVNGIVSVTETCVKVYQISSIGSPSPISKNSYCTKILAMSSLCLNNIYICINSLKNSMKPDIN